MDLEDIIRDALLQSGLTQYPDKKLYKAAQLLKPEDRPKVPVRTVDPDPKAMPIFRTAPNTAAIADAKHNGPILINRQSREYQDADHEPLELASLLAHEAMHYGPTGDDEVAAYRKALDVLKASHLRDAPFTRGLESILIRYEKQQSGANTAPAKPETGIGSALDRLKGGGK
jgi:hypothetical protein